MSEPAARPGLWGLIDEQIESLPASEVESSVWEVLVESVDIGRFRPKLADDIEIREVRLRWGNDYALLSNPRDQILYQLPLNELELVRLMDGTRTWKEIVVDHLQESGDLDLSGVSDLVRNLYAGNFLDRRYVDTDAALTKALDPASPAKKRLRQFAGSLTIEWKNADRFVRWLYEHGLRYMFTRVAQVPYVAVVVVGFLAFLHNVHTHRYGLSGKSLAVAFFVLLFLNYFGTCVHELAHASVLIHYGRKVKSAGFLLYFGSPALYVETADGLLLDRPKRILQVAAGVYGEIFLAALFSMAVYVFPNLWIDPLFYRVALLSYFVSFLNLIPLLELDGYWILTEVIQVPELRPRSLAFIRHDLWYRLRKRQGLSRQEVGLVLYGVLGVAFTFITLFYSFELWRAVTGSFLARLWNGGATSRLILLGLAVFITGPLIRGLINLLRALVRRLKAVWMMARFRMQTKWRVEAASLIDALPMFDDLPEEILSDLAGRVELRTVARGQPIVRQGERADAFYMVRRGTLEVVEQDPLSGNESVLRILGRGEAFGEVGLVESAPRTATVRALEESQVFQITKGTFDQLLAGSIHLPRFTRTAQGLAELSGLPAFTHLEHDELVRVLDQGDWANYAPGETVIEQGDAGDAFYAIENGQVEVYEDGTLVRTMGPGTHFGEIALLLDVPRTATVVAKTPLRVFRLSREGFDGLIRQAFGGGTLNPIISPDQVKQH